MSDVIDIRTRKPIAHPYLRLVAAVRQAQYVAAVAEGYVPRALPAEEAVRRAMAQLERALAPKPGTPFSAAMHELNEAKKELEAARFHKTISLGANI